MLWVALPGINESRAHTNHLPNGCLRSVGRLRLDAPDHGLRKLALTIPECFGDDTKNCAGVGQPLTGRDHELEIAALNCARQRRIEGFDIELSGSFRSMPSAASRGATSLIN